MISMHVARRAANVIALCALGAFVACSDQPTPSNPLPAPAKPLTTSVAATGNQFAWLNPLGTGVANPGAFDATTTPVVEICVWNGTSCTGPVVARFSTTPNGNDLPLARNTTVGRFEAAWSLLSTAFTSRRTYRISVFQGTTQLGAVLVDVVRGRWGLRETATSVPPLVAASELPIQFATFTGGGEASIGSSGGQLVSRDGRVSLAVPAGALATSTVLTVVPATGLPSAGNPLVPGTGWDFGPDGLQFARPVVLTIAYDPALLPSGTDESELRIHKLVNGAYVQQDAGRVDLVNKTVSAEISTFSVYVIFPRIPQNPQDVEAPLLRSMLVRSGTSGAFSSATTLNVSAGDATLNMRIGITDNLAGVRLIDVRWESPSGQQYRFPCYFSRAPDSGSDTNGEWICSSIFPRYAEAGLWKADVVWLWDAVQNNALYANRSNGFCDRTGVGARCFTSLPQVTVVTATPDVTSPVISSMQVSIDGPTRSFGSSISVDASAGARPFVVRVQAIDNLSGIGNWIAFDGALIRMLGPSGQFFERSCAIVSGSVLNGTFDCAGSMPAQAELGTWRVSIARFSDRAGNGGWSGRNDYRLNTAGLLCNNQLVCVAPPTVVVTNVGDGVPPSLQTVTIQSNSNVVTTSLGFVDNPSGVQSVLVRYRSVLTSQTQTCQATRTSGTAKNGTWGCAITFSTFAALGQWGLELETFDIAGNRRIYTRRTSDGFLCYTDPSSPQVCSNFGTTDIVLR